MIFTNAASRNDERNGARKAQRNKNRLTSRKQSKRNSPETSLRTAAAPIKASQQLLTNQARTIAVGTPLCISAVRCAGNADKRNSHHQRGGASSKAPSRIELGGQNIEIG
jgi:hypothetical protein